MDLIEGATYFALVVGCPKCKTILKIVPADEATKGIKQYLKKKESLNRVEKLNETGDYEVGSGGTAIERYYCPDCHIFFKLVADVSHEIIE